MFADITFELDDGRIRAHRAMLVARCEVMRAMLNGDFREAHAHTVSHQSCLVVQKLKRFFRFAYPG
jgi:BTB/POZ domain